MKMTMCTSARRPCWPEPESHGTDDPKDKATGRAGPAGIALNRARGSSCVALRISTLWSISVLSGCVDEKIVFQDRELFEDPPSAAMSFLGYTDHDTKLTGCGNCHIGPQGQWEETAHASAWAGLQASGSAQSFCEGC